MRLLVTQVLVAPRKRPHHGRMARCKVCSLPLEARQQVNEAIWAGTQTRVRNYRQAGVAVFEIYTPDPIESKAITRHADHIEKSWRLVDGRSPPSSSEETVFASDYVSLVDQAADVSVQALQEVGKRVAKGDMVDRDLISAAKLGVQARSAQEKNKQAEKQNDIDIMAIFGMASGHLAELPEGEAIVVTPEGELLEEVHNERRRLEQNARG